MRCFALMTTLACLAPSAPAFAAEKTLQLNGENTKIEFVGSKPDGKHDGGFKTLKGTATGDLADPTTIRFHVEIDTESLWSDDPKLTAHLKNPDFFDVRKHPKASFKTTKIEKRDIGLIVTGELSILGVTKPIRFPAKLETTDQGLTFSTQFEIDRTNYGMNYGQGKINNLVKIKVSIDAN